MFFGEEICHLGGSVDLVAYNLQSHHCLIEFDRPYHATNNPCMIAWWSELYPLWFVGFARARYCDWGSVFCHSVKIGSHIYKETGHKQSQLWYHTQWIDLRCSKLASGCGSTWQPHGSAPGYGARLNASELLTLAGCSQLNGKPKSRLL